MKFLMWAILLTVSSFSMGLDMKGDVYINGKKANKSMKVNLGDFVKTGKNSNVKFKIGQDAFKAKANTRFVISEKKGVKSLNVVTGGVIGVFKKGSKYNVQTENMTAGIRGTGVYIEATPEGKSYFCTCYGDTDVQSKKGHKHMHATHHNMIWVKKDGTMKAAKEMRNHEDDELRELEAMVGRVPAFDR